MNILFVLENLSYNCGANVSIALQIVKRMSGHNILALVECDETRPLDTNKTKCFSDVISFKDKEYSAINTIMESARWKKTSSPKKYFQLLVPLQNIIYAGDFWLFDSVFSKNSYKDIIEKVCIERKIDVVIGVSVPYYILRAIKEANITCKKIALQLDPYTYNHVMPKWRTRIRKSIEKKVVSAFDALLVHTPVANEMRSYIPAKEQHKIINFELPGIDKAYYSSMNSKRDNKTIDFVFTGRFYRDIRNPEYLLRLFSKLPPNYYLHVVGGGADEILGKYANELKERLVLHGWMDTEKTQEIIKSADVLVNLNNSIRNQMASKLFQYISTGKPIINICKIRNCPSLQYVVRYSNAISVFEDEATDNAVQRIENFVKTNVDRILPWCDIDCTYVENNYEYAAILLSSVIG